MFGHYLERIWPADFTAYGGRRRRGAFQYKAFVPDRIAPMSIDLPASVAGAVNAAEHALIDAEHAAEHTAGFETLSRQLLRGESVASSYIEGLELSHRRLARAAFIGTPRYDETAHEVLGNIAAMEQAIKVSREQHPIAPDELLCVHEHLLRNTLYADIAGRFRVRQNWIGRNESLRDAEFVPPPPEFVPELMNDLCEFIERSDFPAVVRAAFAHAQFETIHPFGDGNGRVGRCLIHMVLLRSNLIKGYVPPVSLVLATDRSGYIDGLTAYRRGEFTVWCEYFAHAVEKAATLAIALSTRVVQLRESWRLQANSPRTNSTTAKLLVLLPGYPVISIKLIQELLGCSEMTAGRTVRTLVDANILCQTSAGRRHRYWEATDVFDLLNDWERQL